jgi:hypothetical protein
MIEIEEAQKEAGKNYVDLHYYWMSPNPNINARELRLSALDLRYSGMLRLAPAFNVFSNPPFLQELQDIARQLSLSALNSLPFQESQHRSLG